MKRTVTILMVMLTMTAAWTAWAEGDDKEKKKVKKPIPVPVYIGQSNIDSGFISKPLFDSLIKQGFSARDSSGRTYDIKSFMFTFCERVLYEDSVGNPMILTDYLSEFSFDNRLKEYQLNAVLERAKWGDTIILEQIKLEAKDSTKKDAFGKAVRLIITN